MPNLRPRGALLLTLAFAGGVLAGFRSDDADCVALADHVVSLASAAFPGALAYVILWFVMPKPAGAG